MENLYFDAFQKYGAALATLYPQQIQAIRDALDVYTETGKICKIEDSFARLAFNMIICDLRHDQGKEQRQNKGKKT